MVASFSPWEIKLPAELTASIAMSILPLAEFGKSSTKVAAGTKLIGVVEFVWGNSSVSVLPA
jgi:hypothetical protein